MSESAPPSGAPHDGPEGGRKDDRAPEPSAVAAEPLIGRRGAYAKGRARRTEILDRALEVLRERGAQGTSLRRIAESIGVSHAALLHYFSSREQLLLAVYQHAQDQPVAPPPLREGLAPGPVADLVRAATVNVRTPGLVQLYSTLLAASLEDGDAHRESRDFFTDRFAELRAQWAAQLARRQEEGTIRADVDPAQIAALVIAASDGLQLQWLLDGEVDLEGALAAFETLLRP